MRIDANSRTAGLSGGAGPRAREAAGGTFAPDAAAPAARTPSAAPVSDVGGLETLLALQALQDPLFAKKKAVRRGRSLLDALEDIKADLLVGRVGEGRLNQLMALITQAREKSQPGLDALLDDIELRARVELAKFGHFPGL